MAEFDRYASEYTDLVDRSTALSGETSEYFINYKTSYLVRTAGKGPWKILDYGCGVGLLSAALERALPGSEVHGFDVSGESIRKAASSVAGRGVFTDNPDHLHADYSLIVVSNVLHHIEPGARRQTLQQLSGRLAKGGRILVFEHNPVNPLTRLVVSRCPFDKGVVLLTPREVSRYFHDAGLRKIRRDYIVFFPKALAFLRFTELFLAWCPAGAQFALLGRKEPGPAEE